jgi:hypothetical protein
VSFNGVVEQACGERVDVLDVEFVAENGHDGLGMFHVGVTPSAPELMLVLPAGEFLGGGEEVRSLRLSHVPEYLNRRHSVNKSRRNPGHIINARGVLSIRHKEGIR